MWETGRPPEKRPRESAWDRHDLETKPRAMNEPKPAEQMDARRLEASIRERKEQGAVEKMMERERKRLRLVEQQKWMREKEAPRRANPVHQKEMQRLCALRVQNDKKMAREKALEKERRERKTAEEQIERLFAQQRERVRQFQEAARMRRERRQHKEQASAAACVLVNRVREQRWVELLEREREWVQREKEKEKKKGWTMGVGKRRGMRTMWQTEEEAREATSSADYHTEDWKKECEADTLSDEKPVVENSAVELSAVKEEEEEKEGQEGQEEQWMEKTEVKEEQQEEEEEEEQHTDASCLWDDMGVKSDVKEEAEW